MRRCGYMTITMRADRSNMTPQQSLSMSDEARACAGERCGRPRLCLVAALAANDVIGRDNRLPWHLPADLAHFKRLTLNKTLLMGRRTWESLPGPLAQRRHIVLSGDPGFHPLGCLVADSLDAAIALAGSVGELMVIGGASLYAQTLPLASRLYLTRIQAAFAGDTRFPPWEPAQWEEVARVERAADDANPYAMTFSEFRRRARVAT